MAATTAKKETPFSLLYIEGEQVALEPSGLDPSDPAIVDFDTYYKPEDITDENLGILKRTMSVLFSPTIKTVADVDGQDTNELTLKPYPPCGEREKYLVLASLLHRARLLRKQIYDLGILNPEQLKKRIDELPGEAEQGPDNLLTRTHLEHLRKLQKFIDKYEEQQQCINIGDIAYGEQQLDLDEKELKELLKQFVFFILQSRHPLKNFKKTDPTASGFVSRLKKNPLGDKFPQFLDTYRAQPGFDIPPIIAQVLEDTNIDTDSMKKVIDQKIEEQKEILLKKIEGIIPPTDPFWTKVTDKKDIASIIDALKNTNNEHLKQIRDCEKKVQDLEAKLKKAGKELILRRLKIQALAARVNQQIQDLQQKDLDLDTKEKRIRTLRGELAAAKAILKKRDNQVLQLIGKYKQQRAQFQNQIQTLQTDNARLQQEKQDLENQLQTLQQTQNASVAQLQQQLAQQTQRADAAEQAKQTAENARDQALADAQNRANELATRTTELATAQASLTAANQQIATLEADIQTKENELNTLRTQLATKTQEEQDCRAQLTALQNQIQTLEQEKQQLQQDIQTKDNDIGLSNQERDEARTRVQELEQGLQTKKQELDDCNSNLQACEAARQSLETHVSGEQQSVTNLHSELAKAKADLASKEKEIEDLKAIVKQLQDQLKKQTTEKAELQQTVGDQTDEIDDLTNQLQQTQVKLQEEREDRDIVTTDRNVLAQKLAQEQKDGKKRLDDQRNQMTDEFKDHLDQTVQNLSTTHQAEIEARDKQIEEYEKVLGVVQNIADWTQQGVNPEQTVTIDSTIEKSNALGSIVKKLVELKKNSDLTPSQQVEMIKQNALMYRCYLIFVASFLWQTNFPSKTKLQSSDPTYLRQDIVQTILPILFDGGRKANPTETSSSSSSSRSTSPSRSSSSPIFNYIPGLYRAIEEHSAGATTKDKYGGKLQAETNIIKRFLQLFYKIARAIEAKETTVVGLDPLDVTFFEELLTKIPVILTHYNGVFPVPYSNLTNGFGELCAVALVMNQPNFNTDLSNKYAVLNGTEINIVTKQQNQPEPNPISYAFLFFSFLVVLRDYLNKTKETDKTQCPLPTILQKPAPNK